MISELAAAGGVRARTLALPAALVRIAGAAGDVLQRLGFRNVALTGDKAGELLGAHWSARTARRTSCCGSTVRPVFGRCRRHLDVVPTARLAAAC